MIKSLSTLILFSLSLYPSQISLKKVFKNHFKIGTALNVPAQLVARSEEFDQLIRSQFNSVVAENCMKWDAINPQPGIYNFSKPDTLVNFAFTNKMEMVGHVLFWHNQTPNWLFKDEAGKTITKDELIRRMRNHVKVLHKRYSHKIQSWDVVNEALNEDGSLRDSPWKQILGDDWVELAFKIAQEELPQDTKLIYNDYNLHNRKKLAGLVRIVTAMQQKGIRIDVVGVQAHWALHYPSNKNLEFLIHTLSKNKVKIHFSELDIDVLPMPKQFGGGAEITESHEYNQKIDPFKEALPDYMQNRLAERYKEIFTIFVKHSSKIDRINFWGLTDEFSWKNQWPVPNRTNHPLLFDREGQAKKAFYSVTKTAKPNFK